MRTEGFVRTLRLPSQRGFTVTLFYLKTVEDRQHPTNVATDPLESSEVFTFQAKQNRSQIAAVGMKIVIVSHVTLLFEMRSIGGVVELMHRATPKQIDKDPCSRRIDVSRYTRLCGFDDFRFCMAASEMLPGCFGGRTGTAEAEGFLREDETIRMSVGQGKPIIIAPLVGPHGHRRVYARAEFAAAEQLVVGSAPSLDELA